MHVYTYNFYMCDTMIIYHIYIHMYCTYYNCIYVMIYRYTYNLITYIHIYIYTYVHIYIYTYIYIYDCVFIISGVIPVASLITSLGHQTCKKRPLCISNEL